MRVYQRFSLSVCLPVSVRARMRVCLCVCPSLRAGLLPIAATNMSSMPHDSVQALAGNGLGHGIPLGQTGL